VQAFHNDADSRDGSASTIGSLSAPVAIASPTRRRAESLAGLRPAARIAASGAPRKRSALGDQIEPVRHDDGDLVRRCPSHGILDGDA
jgi:hypothetical protein